MRALAAHIGNRGNRIVRHVMLNVEMPLLHVGPSRFIGDGDYAQGQLRSRGQPLPNIRVADNIELLDSDRQRRRVLERLRVGFVAVGMFVEHAIAAADSPLPVTPWIPGKTEARRRVKEVSLHAARRSARSYAALHYAIGQVANGHRPAVRRKECHGTVRVNGGLALDVTRRVEVERLVLLLSISLEAADAQAQIQGKAISSAPVVLEVGLEEFVTVVVLEQVILLTEAVNIPDRKSVV